MISDIDTDRIALKKQVEEAENPGSSDACPEERGQLCIPDRRRAGEINREIENQNVEMAEVISKASEIIFEDIFSDKEIPVSRTQWAL